MNQGSEKSIYLVTGLAVLMAHLLGACSTRAGIDIDDPEISNAHEQYQEAFAAYEEVAEYGHAWANTADLLRMSYAALENDEPELSQQYSSRAQQEAELALKQHTQQYEYANVFDIPIRCAVKYPELDCPGYAVYAEAQQQEDGFTDAVTDANVVNGDTYEVVRGDSLWKISELDSIYGDPFRWPLIFKTNASKIKDADLIFPRQRFNIFRGFSQADVDRATGHARTRGAWIVGEREESDEDYLLSQ